MFEWLGSLDANDDENLSSLSFALIMCWQIWKMRSTVVFNKANTHPVKVASLAFNMAHDFCNVNKRWVVPTKNQARVIRWIPPADDVFELNFEGSVKNNGAAGGFVIRNDCGDPVLAGARNLGEVSINVAECLALRDALWMARCRGLQKIVVEGDSKLIIEAV